MKVYVILNPPIGLCLQIQKIGSYLEIIKFVTKFYLV